MSKITNFFYSLKKSTRITLISCICFVAMTFVILCFFIMFPITPSEKVLRSYGRESVSKQSDNAPDPDGNGGDTVVVTTTGDGDDENITTTASASRTEFEITFTTGKGFITGGRIPTGVYPNENYTTSAQPYTESQYPAFPDDPPATTSAEEPTDFPGEDPTAPVEDPTEPVLPGGEDPTEPVVTEPVTADIPTEPPVTEPPTAAATEISTW